MNNHSLVPPRFVIQCHDVVLDDSRSSRIDIIFLVG
jgi:hypothetical protein